MKKRAMIIAMAALALTGFVACSSAPPQRSQAIQGQWMDIERAGQPKISGIFYPAQAAQSQKVPLVINVHGGAFIKGKAADLDAQSKRIGEQWGAAVYNLDYTLVPALKLFGKDGERLVQVQVDELTDTVLYFKHNAARYNIDPDRIILLGYSSGGYVVLASTLALAQQGQAVAGQVIAYGFIKDAIERHNALPAHAQKIASTLFVFTESKDPISEGIRPYYELLREKGVDVSKLEFTKARHAFMEEFAPGGNNEQSTYVEQAENQIGQWISRLPKY